MSKTKPRVPLPRAVDLEHRATQGARERGTAARGCDIAYGIEHAFGSDRGGPAEFLRRTGIRVTAAELRAIARLPKSALIGAITDAQRTAAKREVAAAVKLRKARLERRWARGRRADGGSTSVGTVSGGLPGMGRHS